MKIKIDAHGVVESRQTYSINNRMVNPNIEVDLKIKNKTRKWSVKSKLVVNVVIMNMLSCFRKNHRLYYSRQKNAKTKNMYNTRAISNYEFMKAIDELESLGYLINHIAPRQYNKHEDKMSSWIQPTPFFISEFVTDVEAIIRADNAFNAVWMPIIMRDENKEAIDYRADEITFAICAVINRMNSVNYNYTFTDHEGEEFTNSYSRMFNNSNFEDGGRFYKAAVLNMENKQSKNRLRILINNKPVVEVDYTALHIFILAEMMGIADTLGDDPYKRVEGVDRSIIKLAVNTMLNCTSRLQAVQSVNKSIRDLGYKAHSGNEVVSAIFKAFPEFKDKFCNKQCTGLKLQNEESWMTHSVANTMSTLGKPFLPVHDSGIVMEEDKNLLIELMCNAYKTRLNVDSIVHMKVNYLKNNAVVKEDVSC